MSNGFIHMGVLDSAEERLRWHLKQGHHTALVGSPGCGTTAFIVTASKGIASDGFQVVSLDYPSWDS